MLSRLIKEIQPDFNKVLEYSQCLNAVITDSTLNDWATNKQKFYDLFGKRLIYEVGEVSFTLNKKEQEALFKQFIEYLVYSPKRNYYTKLINFLKEQEEGFFTNTIVTNYLVEDSCDPKVNYDVLLTKGQRLVRSFKHFLPKEEVELIQNKASEFIQEAKLEGTFCLSIHPLDFLSISENTYNWRSCHALDGEYRAGNLSYMKDDCTFIAYVKSDKTRVLPNFPPEVPWNSKKWRCLFYFSQDNCMLFAGKEYPKSYPASVNFLIEALNDKEALGSAYGPNYSWSNWITTFNTVSFINETVPGLVDLRHNYVYLDRELLPVGEVMEDSSCPLHYNDVLHSSSYKNPLYSILTRKQNNIGLFHIGDKSVVETYMLGNKLKTKFKVGKDANCVVCDTRSIYKDGDRMLCYSCFMDHETPETSDLLCYCDCCSDVIFTDNAYTVGDYLYCEECYDNEIATCFCCGYEYPREEMIYDEGTSDYYCTWCFRDLPSDEQAKILGAESEEY